VTRVGYLQTLLEDEMHDNRHFALRGLLTTLLIERVEGGGNLFAFLRVRVCLVNRIYKFGVIGSKHIQLCLCL